SCFRSAGQDVSLHCSAERYYFIGIQFNVWLTLEESLYQSTNARDARRSADEYNLIDFLSGDLGISKRLLGWGNRLLNDRLNQLLKLFARDFALIEVATWQFDIQLRAR